MNVQQHPDLVWLIDYAAGTLSRGFEAVIAGHLGICADCRGFLHTAEHVGERLTQDYPPLTPRIDAAAIRARAYEGNIAKPSPRPAALSVRDFIAEKLGFEWHKLPWRSGISGLRIARLQDHDDERIWLLHAQPGLAMPEHTHGGSELTLVLHGAYRSGATQFNVGDIDENDEGITHRQTVTPDNDCISLLVFEGRLKYTGWMGLAQRFLKF